jgi:hypothetical protein
VWVVQSLQAGRAVDVFTSLSEVWRGLRHQPPDGLAIAVLGLLRLIATPVAGVAVATVWFWQQRDRPYALISAVVLAMLLLSLVSQQEPEACTSFGGHITRRSQRRPLRARSQPSSPHVRPARANKKMIMEVTKRAWKPCWPKLIHWLARP